MSTSETRPRMAAVGARCPGGFTVTVEHDRAQSFRRSVDPKAQREAALFGLFAGYYRIVLTDVNYGARREGARCFSVYHYTARVIGAVSA